MSATLDPRQAPAEIVAWLAADVPRIDAAIDAALPTPATDPGRLVEAMRYAALGPGKRLRPALALAACAAVGGTRDAALPAAVAVELLHAYTLVHDDLPAMDDDDERRGRATVHVAFGEAVAVLAGDGLQAAAFAALAELGAGCAAAVRVLGQRAGAAELLGGQALDVELARRGDAPTAAQIATLHAGKTGALFAAACELGGIAGGADDAQRAQLAEYGLALGIAFQHADDRDDGEHAALAVEHAAQMRALCARAEVIAAGFGPAGSTLAAVAAWIGARA